MKEKQVSAITIFAIIILTISVSYNHAKAQINCQSEIYTQGTGTPEDRFKKGYCFIKLGKFQEGVTSLTGLESQLPIVADYILYYQGAGYQNMADFQNASAAFNKVVTQYPESGVRKKTFERLGTIYTETGDYANAERTFRSLYGEEKSRPKKASYLFSLGNALEKQGKYREASAVYKEVWLEYPETKGSSDAYRAAQNLSQTQGVAWRASQSDYAQRANTLFKRSRWNAALNNYDKVASKSADMKTNMGIAMVNTKQLNEAERILRNINSPRALFWRGKLKSKQGLDSEASDLYYRIHLSFPNSELAPEGLYNAARLYQINGQTDRAVKIYDELIRKYPKNKYAEDGAWYLGWIYYRKGMYPEALGTFSSFTDAKSTFNASNSRYWKARTLEKQGRRDEAMAEYTALAALTTPTYHSYLAQKKTGIRPNYQNMNPESVALSTSANTRKDKTMFLIRYGMLEEAKLETEKMQEEANTQEEFVLVSLLYAKVDDYYNSIKVAQGIGLPQANTLSFPRGYKDIVRAYSKKYGVDELMVYSIMREESRFQKDAVSPADAVGLMQLIPPTARTVARQIGISGFTVEMLTIPRVNIEMGIFYFKQVLDKWDGDVELALASYNAGPHRAADWKVRFYGLEKDEFIEEVPFRETRNYIRRILRSYGAYKAIYGASSVETSPSMSETEYPVN